MVCCGHNSYPKHIRQKMMILRQPVLDTVSETEGTGKLQEAIKRGEPSYLTRSRSAIKTGWKKSEPDQYAMYFHCKTKLVNIFKELYRDKFKFENNRAIVFDKDDEIANALYCIVITCHNKKYLPMLGA